MQRFPLILLVFSVMFILYAIYEDKILEEEIAQMLILHVKNKSEILKAKELKVGGVHLGVFKDEEEVFEMIREIQNSSEIPLFIAVDLEGCLNPFYLFKKFPNFSEIENEEEAYKVGLKEGNYLKKFGINMNFAPVLDLEDKIWKCRAFKGNASEIAKKGKAYIKGLQNAKIISIAKHFPGRSMDSRDPHKELVFSEIRRKDILPFREAIGEVNGIMVSHVIAKGFLDSEGKPCSTSKKCINYLKKLGFKGLIISDDINMHGLRKFYKNERKMYLDLVNAGNNIIIWSNWSFEDVKRFIKVIKYGVLKGSIRIEKIHENFLKILAEKRYLNKN